MAWGWKSHKMWEGKMAWAQTEMVAVSWREKTSHADDRLMGKAEQRSHRYMGNQIWM
jgi:hypothetical protein